MRDQDVDLACIVEEGEELQPLRLRYGVTAAEATHREPLDIALSQEEAESAVPGDESWDDIDLDPPAVVRTRVAVAPDDLDEEQVALAAEQAAMHSVWPGFWG